MRELHFVVPEGIDDPRRPSGGNVYDRRVIDGLRRLGWVVHQRRADELDGIPDGALVVLDGLMMSKLAAQEPGRLRLVVLLHMPIESPVLLAATATVTTSHWTRQWLLDTYGMADAYVVEPGAEIAGLAPGTPSGGSLLCVGAVTPTKGHDVLVDALAELQDLEWRCVCVGSLEIAPDFATGLRNVDGRVVLTGPLTGTDLDEAYAGADLLVSASRAESYGMVVTEALAHGLPVIATEVGGVPEALGHPDAGVLVPPEDPLSLEAALRRWLMDAGLREQLREAAQARRLGLTDWSHTSIAFSAALEEARG